MAEEQLKKQLKISGMKDSGCSKTIENILEQLNGVDKVAVNFATATASVVYEPRSVSYEDLKRILHAVGYEIEAELKMYLFKIGGMGCADCAGKVVRALRSVDGVEQASVNFKLGFARVKARSNVTIHQLQKAVKEKGYAITPVKDQSINFEEDSSNTAVRNCEIAWVLTVVVMGLQLIRIFFLEEFMIGFTGQPALSSFVILTLTFFLSGLVVFYPGYKTVKSAVSSLLKLNCNLDVLITMGCLAALLTAPIVLMGIPVVDYSILASFIMSVHLTGRYFESKTGELIKEFTRQILDRKVGAVRIIRDGEPVQIKQGEIKVGDIVIVKTGEQIPVDGEIVEGESKIDESMLMSDDELIVRGEGEEVLGSTVNMESELKVRSLRVGRNTLLSRICRLVSQDRNLKSVNRVFLDRIAAWLAPAGLALSVLSCAVWILFPDRTGFVAHGVRDWLVGLGMPAVALAQPSGPVLAWALTAAFAVLIVTSFCTLSLAAAAAFHGGVAVGIKRGTLLRSAEAIKNVKVLVAVLIDKSLLTSKKNYAAVETLKKMGLEIHTFKVEEGFSEIEKKITRLQQGAKRAAVITGEINAAPALMSADVAVAIGGGADIIVESADITLVGSDLTLLSYAFKLARRIFKKINMNIFVAGLLYIFLIPIAVAGFLHPVVALIIMFVATLAVIINSRFLLI